MRSETLKSPLFWIIVVVIAVALHSCGTRKTTTNLEKMEDKGLFTANSDQIFETDNRRYVYTTSADMELVPVDNTKPMIVNGKSYWNAKFKQKQRQTIDTSKVATKEIAKNKVAVQHQSSSKTKAKSTHRKTYWGMIVGAVLFGVFFVYFKRYFK